MPKLSRDQVIEALREVLMRNSLNGNEFISEARLVELIGVSRTSIRESLNTLNVFGLLEKTQKRGVRLRKLSAKAISEIFDLRILLEGYAMEYAVKNITLMDINELEYLARLVELATSADDKLVAAQNDLAFHRKLIELSHINVLKKVTGNLYLIESVFSISLNRKLSEKRDPYSHQDIIKALKANAAAKAKNVLIGHITWMRDEILESIKTEGKNDSVNP